MPRIEIVEYVDTPEWRNAVARIYIDLWNEDGLLEREIGSGNKQALIAKTEKQISARGIFSRDQAVAVSLDDGWVPVACMNSLKVRASSAEDLAPGWHELTGDGFFYTHKKGGNALVCPSVVVKSDFQRYGIMRSLLARQLENARKAGIQKVFAYSRPAGYQQYVQANGEIGIEDYLGLGVDHVISRHQKYGARIARIIANGRPQDFASRGYNVVMEYSL